MKSYITFDNKKKIVLNDAKTAVTISASMNIEKAFSKDRSYDAFKEFWPYISKCLKNSGLDSFSLDADSKKLYMTVTGHSTCSNDDEYNRAHGIRLADTRAQKKVYSAISRALEKLQELIQYKYVCLDNVLTGAIDTYYSIHDHEYSLMDID